MAGFVPRAVALRHKSTKPKDSTSFQADGIFGGDTCASPVHTHAGQNTSSEATCQVSSSLIQVRSSELLRLVDLDSSSPKATVAAILPSPSILRKQPPTRRCDDHSASFPMNCAPSWHSQANAEVVSYSPRSNLSLSCLANSNLLSYPNGCVIWLSGLPDTLLNKLHVANLVTRILQFETGKPSRITIPASPSSHTHRAPAVIKYVDFQKGLDNCHVRLCDAAACAAFMDSLPCFVASCSKPGDQPTCSEFSKLKASPLSGRREAIYWEKIPRHLWLL